MLTSLIGAAVPSSPMARVTPLITTAALGAPSDTPAATVRPRIDPEPGDFALVPAAPRSQKQLVKRWLGSLDSAHTRRTYRYAWNAWVSWLYASGTDLLGARRTDVDAWRLALTGAPATRAHKLSGVSSFYAYAVSQGALEINPFTRVRQARTTPSAPTRQSLTTIQVRYLLAHAKNHSPRAHALVHLLLTTGLRVSEALAIRYSDFAHITGTLELEVTHGAGTQTRVPITAEAVVALEAYLGHHLDGGARTSHADHPLFTTATGKPWDPTDAYRTLRRIAMAAGIPGRISPQLLRHTHAALASEPEAGLDSA